MSRRPFGLFTEGAVSRKAGAPSILVGLVVAFVVAVVFGAGLVLAYRKGFDDGRIALPPLLLADSSPIWIPAELLPPEPSVEPKDLNIYGVISGFAAADDSSREPDSPPANRKSARTDLAKDAVPAAAFKEAEDSGYAVQLAASKSPDAARSAYRRLKADHGDILGDRAPVVRRVDLGEGITFFRLSLSGFADRESAVALCDALKGRGADCFVRRRA